MRAVLTRVSSASVRIGGAVRGEIGRGFLILLGVGPADTPDDCAKLANKALGLRIFTDGQDKMNLSLSDVGGEVLVVSQFTLYGDCKKGRRPSFVNAGPPQLRRCTSNFWRNAAPRGSSRVTASSGPTWRSPRSTTDR